MPDDAQRSALDRAAALVGDRWTLLIVHALLGGSARYSQLGEAVADISPTVLASRLKQLEEDGLVVAVPYQDRPVRHEYRLTDPGRALAGVLDLLAAWGDPELDAPTHQPCGTPLTVVHWCPTCDRPADPDDQGVTM